MNAPRDHTVRVLARRDYGPSAYLLDLDAPDLAAQLSPGQFLMVEIPGARHDPLLRRPLGYLWREGGRIGVLVQKAGHGTRVLGDINPGLELRVLGPLGRGWTMPESGPVLLAAGGIGVAPLYDLAVRSASLVKTVFVYGARNENELYVRDELSKLPLELVLATDDGSRGLPGTAVDALRGLGVPRFSRYYACGPRPMLAAVQAFMLAAGVMGELSLEERMACGFGACLGCAVAVAVPGGGRAFKRVCSDGPVFPAGEVILDARS